MAVFGASEKVVLVERLSEFSDQIPSPPRFPVHAQITLLKGKTFIGRELNKPTTTNLLPIP